MATHSSVLAWRIPGTIEPDRLPSMGSHRVRHDWGDLAAAAAYQLVKMHRKILYHHSAFEFVNPQRLSFRMPSFADVRKHGCKWLSNLKGLRTNTMGHHPCCWWSGVTTNNNHMWCLFLIWWHLTIIGLPW